MCICSMAPTFCVGPLEFGARLAPTHFRLNSNPGHICMINHYILILLWWYNFHGYILYFLKKIINLQFEKANME